MGLGDHSEYYRKGSRTWKENWSAQCSQSIRAYLHTATATRESQQRHS